MPKLVSPLLAPGSVGSTPQPTLVGDGLVVRPWLAADAEALVAAYADPAIRQWHARSMDPDEVAGWLRERAERWTAGLGGDWAVADGTVHDPGAVVGRVSLGHLELAEAAGEVGYWTLPAARGRSIAPRSLGILCSWAFGVLGLHRLELSHAVGNPASCRVAEKAGFGLEGTSRQQALHADGWHDMHRHARLATDQ